MQGTGDNGPPRAVVPLDDDDDDDLKEMGANVTKCMNSAQDSNYWRVIVSGALNLWVS